MRSLVLFSLFIALPLAAQSPREDVAPFMDAQTIAVVRVRPDKLNDAVLADWEKKLLPESLHSVEDFKSPLTLLRERAKEWSAAGGGDVYVVVSFLDIPRQPPFAVLLPQAGKKADDLAAVVKRWDANFAVQTIGKALVLGGPETLARLKDAKPGERPELVQALSAGPDVAARVVLAPSPEVRRIYAELLPPFPPNTVSVPSSELFQGLKSVTAEADLSANSALRISLQATDAAAAEKWKDAIRQAAAVALKVEPQLRELPAASQTAAHPAPTVRGDRVEMVWSADGERLPRLMNDIVKPLAAKAYESAATMQSVNSLKQIMLAMHNFHDAKKSFPPQAILSKDGKKLLSWRVAILPYLDAGALHGEFKLDEPWDSEHNRKLIAKMPAVYGSNLMPKAKTQAGFTPFVVPVGEGTCFGKPEGVPLKDITDGTSNTICVVQAIPSAVEWTKPADWDVDFNQPAKGWRRGPLDPKEMLPAGYGDGSVHRIPAATPDDTLRFLLKMADGNVIPHLP